jgi:flagellar protein FliS
MPAPTAALAAYTQSAAATATPREVVRMAYERVLTACDRAEQAARLRPPNWMQTFHDETIRGQSILLELMSGLAIDHHDQDVAALSRHLESLYRYAMNELLQANVHKSAGPIAAARMVISGLHDAWVSAV